MGQNKIFSRLCLRLFTRPFPADWDPVGKSSVRKREVRQKEDWRESGRDGGRKGRRKRGRGKRTGAAQERHTGEAHTRERKPHGKQCEEGEVKNQRRKGPRLF